MLVRIKVLKTHKKIQKISKTIGVEGVAKNVKIPLKKKQYVYGLIMQ